MTWNPGSPKFCASLIPGLENSRQLKKDSFISWCEVFLKIVVNGENKELTGPASLEELIQQLGVRKETVVAEVNRRIIQLDQRSGLQLSEGDQIELIQFVGGG
jgi:thiamine biosynthesis protein ThiS